MKSPEIGVKRDKNGENVPKLEIAEVIDYNLVIYRIQKFCIHSYQVNHLNS